MNSLKKVISQLESPAVWVWDSDSRDWERNYVTVPEGATGQEISDIVDRGTYGEGKWEYQDEDFIGDVSGDVRIIYATSSGELFDSQSAFPPSDEELRSFIVVGDVISPEEAEEAVLKSFFDNHYRHA